jgi:hypothetical protein
VFFFLFHLMTDRTVCYILFFILWQIERCAIFCHLIIFLTVCYILFFIYDSSKSVLYFVFHLRKIYHTVRTVIKWKTKYTTHVNFFLINYSMNEILPFRKSYYRLVLANFHFMLKSSQNYSFCIKLERKIILWNKNVSLSEWFFV